MKTLLFIGHPGHELLAHKFMVTYKPDVIFLTSGSGSNNQPRINQSINLVKSLGLKIYYPFEPYTDRQIYDLILSHSVDTFLAIKFKLKQFVIEKKIELIVGDALEGFNPSHDICRYLINSTVLDIENKVTIKNYDFFQDDVRKNYSSVESKEDIVLELNERELQNKMDDCFNYPELKFEVNKFIGEYGTRFFTKELFRKVNDPYKIIGWNSEYPYYEDFGRQRVKEGIYKDLITFENHMKVIALGLQSKTS